MNSLGRMQESSLFMSSSGQRYTGAMSYSSLTDKHLQEYFMKKFMNPRPPSGVSKLYNLELSYVFISLFFQTFCINITWAKYFSIFPAKQKKPHFMRIY